MMRKRLLSCVTIMLIISMLQCFGGLCGAMARADQTDQTDRTTLTNQADQTDHATHATEATEDDEFEYQAWRFPLADDVMDDPEGIAMLVNADHLLDEAYKPADMMYVKVRVLDEEPRLARRDMAAALERMFAAAERDGIYLYVSSTYRSYAKQRAMYYNNRDRAGEADRSVQVPGASEHQTGLAADVISRDWMGRHLDAAFAESAHGRWLAERCAEFGFIIRYPADKEEITGITFEPWHLRYVGVDAAKFIMGDGLTLEEFWELWEIYLSER